jgi:hypothetical protein
MTQVVQASELTLHEVKTQLGLQETEDEQFFSEWQEPLSELTDVEQRSLDQVKADFLYLNQYPMSEEVVKLVVLSPLLKMAGFYSPPFRMRTEAPVQIALEDEGKVLRGQFDVLVLQNRFWVLVVESKEAGFSLKEAIPQALAYMIGNPYPDGPSFGLTTNGSEFRFLKLVKQETPRYALSDLFTLQRRDNDLYPVLRIMKRIGELVTS